MFWLRNKKNNFPLHTRIWGPDTCQPTKSDVMQWRCQNTEKVTHIILDFMVDFDIEGYSGFIGGLTDGFRY